MEPYPAVFDPALPGLEAALDPAVMSPKLGSLLEPGSPPSRWRVVGVELIKHKPGRRCSLGYTVENSVGRQRLFAKTFRNDRGAAILVNMINFCRAVAGRGMLIPEPLGYIPELRLLITEFVDGRSLAMSLYEGQTDESARRMAGAASILHGCGVACARRWTPEREHKATAEWINGVKRQEPVSLDPRSRNLLDQLEEWSAAMPSHHEVPVHRDFYPEQLLDSSGFTAMLDLDDARAGDPAVDVGNFMAHLKLRSLQFPETTPGCARARDVFLRHYLRQQRPATEEVHLSVRARYYEASTLLRLAGVYSARERWAATLPSQLLDSCEAILEER